MSAWVTLLKCERCLIGDDSPLTPTSLDDEAPTLESADDGDLAIIHVTCLADAG